MSLVDRLLSLIGFDLDFSLDLTEEAFSPIHAGLTVGRRPQRDDVAALRRAGVTHVVSCLQDAERGRVTFLKDEFETLFVPVRDGMHEDIASSFPTFFDFAAPATASGARVLVHCEAGVSRSGSLATALVMKSDGTTFFDAVSAIRARRPRVLPNIGFASQLQHLEHSLFPEVAPGHDPSSLARYLHELCNVPIEIEVLEEMLERHDYDAPRAIGAIFGGEIPRVVQGVRR